MARPPSWSRTMLRSSVILIGAIAFACGIAALFAHIPPGWVFPCGGAGVVLSSLYERVTYKPIEACAPGPGWTKTDERFIDDATGEAVTVWLQPPPRAGKNIPGGGGVFLL